MSGDSIDYWVENVDAYLRPLTVGSNVVAHVTACETCERSRLKISLLHSEDFDLQLHKQSHCQGNAIVLGAKPAWGG